MTIKQIVRAPVLRRAATIDLSTIDVEARTVRVAFASETPYLREFGYEVLNVAPESIDDSYLRNGCSVLLQHDWNLLIGVVLDYSIDADRIARATVKFGRSALANEVFQDVQDGLRPQISFGYQVKGMAQENPIAGVASFRVTSYLPFEISFVSVGADVIGAGVGKSLSTRDAEIEVQPIEDFIKALPAKANSDDEDDSEDGEDEEKAMAAEGSAAEEAAESPAEEAAEPQVEKAVDTPAEDAAETPAEEAAESPADEAAEDNASEEGEPEVIATRSAPISVTQNDPRLESELARVATLTSLGERFRAVDVAQHCIKGGLDVESFKQLVLQSKSKGNKMEIGLNAQETARFNLFKAFEGHMSGRWDGAELERDVALATSQAMSKAGRAARGLAVPLEILTRTNNATSATAGGNLIQTNVMGGSFIEMLYNKLVLTKLGAQLITADSPFSLPKGQRTDSASFVDENGDAPTGEGSFSQVPFTPKRIADSTRISKRLIAQSSVDVESLFMADFARRIALGIEKYAINGDGVGVNPLGVLKQLGLGSVIFAGATPTHAELVALETAIADKNLDGSAFLVSPVTRGALKSTPVTASGYPVFLMEGNEMLGYPTATSKVIPNGQILFGDFSQLIIAHFSSLDFVLDPFTYSGTNQVYVTCGMDVDVNVRHAEAFALGKA
jgi:HK97 family phage major capsid protein